MARELVGLVGPTWVHSHEEDHADLLVFRPEAFPFPRSRGRMAFRLLASGDAVKSGPSPDDRRTELPGDWRLVGQHLHISTSGSAYDFDVEACDAEQLVVRARLPDLWKEE